MKSNIVSKIKTRLLEKSNEDVKYLRWIKNNEIDIETIEAFNFKPLISVVAKYITPQSMDNYELVSSINEAKGEYICMMGDGELSTNAIYEITKKLNQDSFDIIYADEDNIASGKRENPFFKPDWSPDTFESFWYTQGVEVFKKGLLGNNKYNHDEAKKIYNNASKIGHINKVLFHRKIEFSYLINKEQKANVDAKISIVIPSKDNFNVLSRCIYTLVDKTKYKNYDITIVDNGSNEINIIKYQNLCTEVGAKYLYKPMDFNFAKMCNIGAKESNGDFILLLNDDIEISDGDWLENMAQEAIKPNRGAVGAKLIYPNSDGLIQHCGVVVFPAGPVHILAGLSDDKDIYFGRNRFNYNYLAVTGACLMLSRANFETVGGLCEDLKVAYNDVALCFELNKRGFRNVVCNNAVLYHHESISRGNDLVNKEKMKRLDEEREILFSMYPEYKNYDPYYNEALSKRKIDFSIKV